MKQKRVIPGFESESEEAEWWYKKRGQVDKDLAGAAPRYLATIRTCGICSCSDILLVGRKWEGSTSELEWHSISNLARPTRTAVRSFGAVEFRS